MGVEVIKSWPTRQSWDVVWPTCLTFSIIYFSSDVSYHLMFELKILASDEEKHDIRYIIICKLIFNFNIFIIRVIPSVVWVEMTFLRQRETWHSLYILSINISFSFFFFAGTVGGFLQNSQCGSLWRHSPYSRRMESYA